MGHRGHFPRPAPPLPEVLKKLRSNQRGRLGGGGDTFPGPVVTTLHFLVMTSAPFLQQATPKFSGLHTEHRRS